MIHTLSEVFPFITSAVIGALAGLLASHWLHARNKGPGGVAPVPPADPFVSAEIDAAVTRWSEANNQPQEVAGLLSDRLHALYALARRRGQS